jgi:hypothetical protein
VSEPKNKPSAEELWEAAGYLRAAVDAGVESDAALAAALAAAIDAEAADATLDDVDAAPAAYARGRWKWIAEHSEAGA